MSHPLVIGTAGHVDHGKTSLVRALTGVDLDRLPEEKARGITIALGFTQLRLPSGRVAGLVDVPGHERLVRTMAAGASGMDAVMLCVAADDGAMPQTREHVAILGLMGVRAGLLVLTKGDLVDEETREIVEEDLRETVRGTFLEGAPCVVTSAQSGEGLDALRAALDLVTTTTRPRDAQGTFRMPVDRAFGRRGFGTVVTGTAWRGVLSDGAEVELAPFGLRARVRGVQVHGSNQREARAGERVALNLAGVTLDEAVRGAQVVVPGSIPSTTLVDVAWTHLADAPAWPREVELVLLHGTREVVGHVLALDARGLVPGERVHAQVRLEAPLACLPGDRFVARRASPAVTVGGGVVLDPWAPRARKRDFPAVVARLARLEAGDTSAWLDAAGVGGLTEEACVARGIAGGVRLAERRYAPGAVTAIRAALEDALAAWHVAHPLSLGPNRRALRVGALLRTPERDVAAVVDEAIRAGTLCGDGARVWAASFAVRLDAAQADWCARALERVTTAGLEGVADLPALLPFADAEALTYLLRDRGDLVEVAGAGQPARLLAPAVLQDLRARVATWFDDRSASGQPQELDPAAFKELSGQSRRTAIPLLEWLDAVGSTRRRGDVRIPGGAP